MSLDLRVTRDDLAEVSRPFIERTLRSIDEAMRSAKVRPRDLDRVILVGGSSRLPIVQQLVANHLDMPAQLSEDADLAVAIGAARLAGRAMGADIADVLLDITPHTLAVGAMDAGGEWGVDGPRLIAAAIIGRGTVVPVERSRTFFTAMPDQTTVDVPISQGEGRLLEENTQLGELNIDDLPPSPAASPVEVVFRLDLSGVLHVSATHVPSGQSAVARIVNSAARMTEKGREKARAQLDELGAKLGQNEAQAEPVLSSADRKLAAAMLKRAARALKNTEDVSAALRQRIDDSVAALKAALDEDGLEASLLTDDLSDALLDLL